jgi:anti-sigma B factor antagonist
MWISVAPRSSYDDVLPAPLEIDVSYPDPDTVVVTPDGEADLFTAPDLQHTLRRASASGRSRLIVDLDRVSFIDAATLGVLVEARLRISAAGGTLQVRSHTRHRRLFFLNGLEGMLHGCR